MTELSPVSITADFADKVRQANDEAFYLLAIDSLFSELERYQTEDDTQNFDAEEHIRESFESFLSICDFQMAQKDFEKLLDETSGDTRNDGTTIWFHQLSAILMFLDAVRDGTIPLEILEQQGGLETALRQHIRHDSVEDTALTLTKFGKQITRYATKELDFSLARQELEMGRNVFVYRGVELMTKKKPKVDKSTKKVKRDLETNKIIKKDIFTSNKAYMHNLTKSPDASGQVWVWKQLDVTHNQGTIEAPKFPTDKRLTKCNEIEDMFGPRHGAAYTAGEKWPEWKPAINRFDNLMAAIVYLNFGELEYVELAYPNDPNKFKEGGEIYPVAGVGKFLEEALKVDTPRAFNPLHIWLDRIHRKRDYHADPKVRQRTKDFLEKAVYPVLAPYSSSFPRIFPHNGNQALLDLESQLGIETSTPLLN